MPKTQRLIVACLALATGVGIGFLLSTLFTFNVAPQPEPLPVVTPVTLKQRDIQTVLIRQLEANGIKTEGISPYLLLEHFPAIEESDFNRVEAIVGAYEVAEGVLTYESGEVVGDAAAGDISEAGFSLFLRNYSERTGIDLREMTAEEIVSHFSQTDSAPDTATSSDEFVACTMDAKECPDGSFVGRTGPNCEFAACPAGDSISQTITCTPEQKQAEACIEIYQPVCASVQIQCITTPCEPIQKTFGNSCEACSQHSVTEYTEGACGGDETAL